MADRENNDAAILTHLIKTNVQDIRYPKLVSLSFIKPGEKQFSIDDVNLSRLVTTVGFHQINKY